MMTKKTIPETVTPTPLEDAARLRELLEGLDISQAEFAEQYGIGSQAQFWQYLNPEKKGGRPLNIMAAIGFAKGIDALQTSCNVGRFSPYLQTLIDKISEFKSPESACNQNLKSHDPLGDLWPIIHTLSQLDEERRNEVQKYAEERLKLQHGDQQQHPFQRAG